MAYNREGSNQIEGVTTFLLSDCTLGGTCRSDVILLESDERFARHTFRHFTPTHYVITNLYRDQLTRNGHPEWIFDILQDSIHPGTRLILNATIRWCPASLWGGTTRSPGSGWNGCPSPRRSPPAATGTGVLPPLQASHGV